MLTNVVYEKVAKEPQALQNLEALTDTIAQQTNDSYEEFKDLNPQSEDIAKQIETKMLEKAGMQAAPNEQVVNKKPKAKALENITISSDDNLTLEDKGSVDEDAEVAKYTWQINEQTKTSKKVDFGKLEAGEYNVSLFVTDNEGRKAIRLSLK